MEARENEDNGYVTVRELIEKTGLSNDTVRARLRLRHELGELEVKLVKRLNIAGIYQAVPGYRLVKPVAE